MSNNAFPIAKVVSPRSPDHGGNASRLPYHPAIHADLSPIVSQKYTIGSRGIWETIRRFFAVDPNRSTGIPLNPQFRNPPPGALDPTTYDDPVSIPAGDIADNPYWKRDMRRSYAVPSVVKQADVVGLLTMGSAASPSPKLLRGEEGSKQLVAVKDEGEKGLAAFLEQQKAASTGVLGEGGMPPMPVAFGRDENEGKYAIGEPSYENKYPCRNFH